MIEKTILVKTKAGLHTRKASILSSTASKFASNVVLKYNDRSVDVKSIMGLMSLAVPNGTDIVVQVDGEDEQQALAAIEEVLQNEE